jgi:hypothetical protein
VAGGVRGHSYDIDHRAIVDGKTKRIRELAELEFDDQGNLRRRLRRVTILRSASGGRGSENCSAIKD